MKKLFLLIPAGLFALSIGTVLSIEYNKPSSSQAVVQKVATTPADIFAVNEGELRQILRYGDEKALNAFPESLNALDGFLSRYHAQGLDTSKIDALVIQYVQDGIKVTQSAPAYMKTLKTTDTYERAHEKKFEVALEQIGLYELKESFENLEKVRLAYIKKPTVELGDTYLSLHQKMKNIITELYLDSSIENPLFAYIDNHKLYFKTVASMYDAIGTDKIERLNTNSYAIQTQLQLLPTL
jgi:hypothetical protein